MTTNELNKTIQLLHKLQDGCDMDSPENQDSYIRAVSEMIGIVKENRKLKENERYKAECFWHRISDLNSEEKELINQEMFNGNFQGKIMNNDFTKEEMEQFLKYTEQEGIAKINPNVLIAGTSGTGHHTITAIIKSVFTVTGTEEAIDSFYKTCCQEGGYVYESFFINQEFISGKRLNKESVRCFTNFKLEQDDPKFKMMKGFNVSILIDGNKTNKDVEEMTLKSNYCQDKAILVRPIEPLI